MFTGIIRYIGTIVKIDAKNTSKRLTIKTVPDLTSKLEKGITSVAINGACHTIEDFSTDSFTVYSGTETLKKTNLTQLRVNDFVNLELPLTLQTFLDGHLVQGHIDGTGKIINIRDQGDGYLFRFQIDTHLSLYLVEKDSISIDGISLTLFNIQNTSFDISVIPETVKNTILKYKREGDTVNIEINLMAKYARQFQTHDKNKEAKLKSWLHG